MFNIIYIRGSIKDFYFKFQIGILGGLKREIETTKESTSFFNFLGIEVKVVLEKKLSTKSQT